MMMWRALSARTICQAAEAVAARRLEKAEPKAADGAVGARTDNGPETAATILPSETTRRGRGIS